MRLDPDTDDPEIRRMLRDKEYGWIAVIERQTGIPNQTISGYYDVHEIRELLKEVPHTGNLDKVSFGVIRETAGLETDERIKLIQKTPSKGWGSMSIREITKSLKSVDDEVRELILDEDTSPGFLPQP